VCRPGFIFKRALKEGVTMHESKFWKAIAVVFCIGLLYVGHGLHNPESAGTALLVNRAHAGQVMEPKKDLAPQTLYTTSQDGKTLCMWMPGDLPPGKEAGPPSYKGTIFVAKPESPSK
jgi:hypothetical protein